MTEILVKLQRLICRNRSITFTPPGTRFVFLSLAVGVAAINTGNNLLYLVVAMLLSLIIVSGILSEQSLRNIQIERFFPARIFARRPVTARLQISNRKRRLPSYSFRINEEGILGSSAYIPRLPAGGTVNRGHEMVFRRRGDQPLPVLSLSTTFPFGFFRKTLLRPRPERVLVYPRILPLPPGLEGGRQTPGHTQEKRKRGVGSDFHSLRNYTRADDARRIHWKASARTSSLLLKEYVQDEDQKIQICLSNHLARGAAEQDRPGVDERSSDVSGVADPIREDFERAIESSCRTHTHQIP